MRSLATLLVAAVGLCWLAMLLALPLVLPVWQFPRPTGVYGIGTLSYHWVDSARADIFGNSPGARRELMAQVWYPATDVASIQRAPYMADAEAVTAAFARIHHLPAFLFKHFKKVTTHAMLSAPVANDRPSYPVLLFLQGATGFRQMNTFQVEELVSHGYIVVAMDQPGVAAKVVFPGGRQAVGLSVDQFQATVSPSYRAEKVAPLLNGQRLVGGSIVTYLAQDVGFALDQLLVLNRADPNGLLTGRMDLQRTGAFGLSLGGIVVGEACPGYFVQVAGLFHSNLTDLPNWIPLAPQLNLAGPIAGQRAHDIVNAYTLAFFDRHLSGKPTPLLDGTAKKYPEVIFESR